MSTRRRAHEVLEFWFGTRPYAPAAVAQRMRRWFGDTTAPELQPQTDEHIRLQFGELTQQAAAGRLARWESSPRRRLALILLLDQFPRNLHRGSAAAYAQDRQALELALGGLQLGADAALDPVERIFFYMPLQHSESRDVQEESLAAFRRLAAEAPADMAATFATVSQYAQLHYDIVERFGRFPHRNGALGRASTPDELTWLAGGGVSFGQ
jgi:uncharacterized protein (DUF924 family)